MTAQPLKAPHTIESLLAELAALRKALGLATTYVREACEGVLETECLTDPKTLEPLPDTMRAYARPAYDRMTACLAVLEAALDGSAWLVIESDLAFIGRLADLLADVWDGALFKLDNDGVEIEVSPKNFRRDIAEAVSGLLLELDR